MFYFLNTSLILFYKTHGNFFKITLAKNLNNWDMRITSEKAAVISLFVLFSSGTQTPPGL